MTNPQGDVAPLVEGEGLNRRITDRIAERMRAGELQRKDLAAALDVDPSAVSRKLAGERLWRVDDLPAVAGFLGVRVADLLDPEEVTPS
jgi:transcriptional regulator with XRE-family HTH domain